MASLKMLQKATINKERKQAFSNYFLKLLRISLAVEASSDMISPAPYNIIILLHYIWIFMKPHPPQSSIWQFLERKENLQGRNL